MVSLQSPLGSVNFQDPQSKENKSNTIPDSRPPRIKILRKGLTITKTIAIVCLATYALTMITRQDLLSNGALNISKVLKGQVWRIVTSPILHVNFFHLISNVNTLLCIGPLTEKRWGTSGFAKVAALSIIADVLVKAVFKIEYAAVGLSGVLYGMGGALIITSGKGFQVNLKSSLKLLTFEVIFGVIIEKAGIMRVDHLAHLSGYVAGLIFGWCDTMSKN